MLPDRAIWYFSLLLTSFGLLIGTGCGKREPKLGQVPVTAKVTLDGSPMENAVVLFVAKVGSGTASALTNAEGIATPKSTISSGKESLEVTGLIPGEYEVGISKTETISIPDPNDARYVKIDKVIYHIPERYNSYQRSGLKATVSKDGDNNVVFDLTGSTKKK